MIYAISRKNERPPGCGFEFLAEGIVKTKRNTVDNRYICECKEFPSMSLQTKVVRLSSIQRLDSSPNTQLCFLIRIKPSSWMEKHKKQCLDYSEYFLPLPTLNNQTRSDRASTAVGLKLLTHDLKWFIHCSFQPDYMIRSSFSGIDVRSLYLIMERA